MFPKLTLMPPLGLCTVFPPSPSSPPAWLLLLLFDFWLSGGFVAEHRDLGNPTVYRNLQWILPVGSAVNTCNIKASETAGGWKGRGAVAGASGVILVALARLLLLQTHLAAVCPLPGTFLFLFSPSM